MLTLLCMLGTDVAAAASPKYNPLTAAEMVLHSDATYCGDDQGGHGSTAWAHDFSCPPCAASPLAGTAKVVGVAQGGGREAFAYVASTKAGDVVVAFRGSVLQANFDDDGDRRLVPWDQAPGALVHAGFLRSYASIRSQIVRILGAAFQRVAPSGTVFLTGHSLGAAQATLAAVDLPQEFPTKRFQLYNFGDLRVGDFAFVELFNASVSASWRVVHRYDSVPQGVPRFPRLYHHVPTEVWYHDDGVSDFEVCDGSGEDPGCQDSVPASRLSHADHELYLNHSMWCCSGNVNSRAQCSFPFPGGPKSFRREDNTSATNTAWSRTSVSETVVQI